ncbi:MAG: sugar transferase [Nannocystaceae bacterium]
MSRNWTRITKCAIDRSGAFAGIVLLAPMWLVVVLLIRVTMGRPVFFLQDRVGKNDRIFKMWKFRTMREPSRGSGDTRVTDIQRGKSDALRITGVGGLLRRTSLDELPQLLNVLQGDMSLVGPRPQLAAYLERYSPRQRRRHEMRPGITGLAQVRGRNTLSWEQKFEYDVQYIDRWSLRLDARLLVETVVVVATGAGVEASRSVTPTEFRGILDTPHRLANRVERVGGRAAA